MKRKTLTTSAQASVLRVVAARRLGVWPRSVRSQIDVEDVDSEKVDAIQCELRARGFRVWVS